MKLSLKNNIKTVAGDSMIACPLGELIARYINWIFLFSLP
jgi:hypothetical protein